MKTITIGWLNKCRCGNKSHTVKTARGNETALWDDDVVKCNSCGRGGVIQVYEGQARVLWETDEEMAEGKPMSTITKQWLQQKIADMEATRDDIPFGLGEDGTNTLAALRIALASLEEEPVAYIFKHPAGRLFWSLTDDSNKGQSDVMPVYTAPPAPANSAPVAWLWSHRKHQSEVTLVRPEDDERADGAHWSGWSCQALYAEPQAPVSVPDALADDIDSDDHPLLWSYNNGWNACRAAMLQGAENAESPTTMQNAPALDSSPIIAESTSGINQGKSEPVTTAYKLPANTPCKDAPEHIWLQTAGVWPENGEFSELTWCSDNQHEDDTLYVRADVVSGNSPVIPDCSCRACRPVTFADSRFVVCPDCGNKRCPHANDHRNACTGSNEPGQEGSAYPAAPQQEVK